MCVCVTKPVVVQLRCHVTALILITLIFLLQYCRQVWLGLYDNSMSSQTESREENKVKDFMAQKYERKRWYVAPSDSLLDKARKLNEASISKQQTKPLKSLLGENAPRLVINNQVNTIMCYPAEEIRCVFDDN